LLRYSIFFNSYFYLFKWSGVMIILLNIWLFINRSINYFECFFHFIYASIHNSLVLFTVKIFHWFYSFIFFNLEGRFTFRSSLNWFFACVCLLKWRQLDVFSGAWLFKFIAFIFQWNFYHLLWTIYSVFEF
jgi:hypothetical protein